MKLMIWGAVAVFAAIVGYMAWDHYSDLLDEKQRLSEKVAIQDVTIAQLEVNEAFLQAQAHVARARAVRAQKEMSEATVPVAETREMFRTSDFARALEGRRTLVSRLMDRKAAEVLEEIEKAANEPWEAEEEQ